MTWLQRLTTLLQARWRALLDEGDEAFEADEQAFLAEAEAHLAVLRQALAEARAQAKRSELELRALGAGPAAARAGRHLAAALARQHQTDLALADRLAAEVSELAARLAELRSRTAALAQREQLRQLRRAWQGGAWRAALDEHEARLARREDRLAAQDEWERDDHDPDA